MHELLEAAGLDGIKAIYDDLLARIGAGKIFQEDMPPSMECSIFVRRTEIYT